MTLRELFFSLGYQVDKNSESKAEQSIKSLKSVATKLLGAIGIGFSLAQLNEITEEFTRVNDQIKNATGSLGNQAEIQQKILQSANDTRTSYEDAAEVISNLVMENQTLFGNVDEAVKFNNAATMLFKSAGKTNEQIAGLMEAINKSFAKGYVDSETMSQLLEQSPEAVALLNQRLGTTSDQLEQMASDGVMTVADLKAAFVDNASAIQKSFGNVRYNVSDALTNIRNQWGLWVADMDESLGLSESIGTIMVKGFTKVMDVLRRVQTRIVWLNDKLGGTDRVLKLLAITAGALLIAFNFSKITSGLSAMAKGIKNVNLKALAIAAIIILIALLIEDFIKFMNGEDSLIGSLFDKSGIGAENARQAILNAWNAIKDFLLKVWDVIKQAAMVIFGALSDWWAENGDAVMESFSKIWEGIKTLCITLWNALSGAAKTIFEALKAFWDTWGETIMTVFGIIWDTLVALIQPFLDALAALIDFLANVFTGNWEGAWQAIKDFAAAIWEMITTIITGAWNIIQAVWGKVAEIFGGIFDNIKNAIVDRVTSIKDSIVNGFQAAIDWIKSLPEQALQWGADIINGIADGIKGAIGKVTEAVSSVGEKIKSFLHFSVPDEGPLTDYENWMPDFMQGLANGISKAKNKVTSAIKDVAGDISVAANANLVSADTASKAGAGTSVSKNITQNVEIKNQFNGDRAGQEKSSTAMEKASDDATSELARAIAFAR